MKNLEAIRKMDNFEKRLADLVKDYATFKEGLQPRQEKSKRKIKTKK